MTDQADTSGSSWTFTAKQMGDACEMLVAAELTLAGIPALKMPDNWPHYDVIAEPPKGDTQRISVKARTYKSGSNFVDYRQGGEFDWIAAVIIKDSGEREFYIIPRKIFELRAKTSGSNAKRHETYCKIDQMRVKFPEYIDNFRLFHEGVTGMSALG